MKGKRSAVLISGLDAGGSGESTPVCVDQMPRCRYLDPTIAHVKRLDSAAFTAIERSIGKSVHSHRPGSN